jgi:hypothetical protein
LKGKRGLTLRSFDFFEKRNFDLTLLALLNERGLFSHILSELKLIGGVCFVNLRNFNFCFNLKRLNDVRLNNFLKKNFLCKLVEERARFRLSENCVSLKGLIRKIGGLAWLLTCTRFKL